MLSVMTNPTVVAWYGVPMRLWGTFLIIPSIVSRVYLPRMVAAHERARSEFKAAARLPAAVSDLLAVQERSREEFKRVARAPVELVFAVSLPVATAIALAAGPGVRLVYGPSYVHATGVLIILGLNLIPMYLNMMLASVCVATGRQGTWNWLLVGATVFNPAVNAILIPLTQRQLGNGAIGAAIALALTEALVAGVAMALVARRIGGLPIGQRGVRMALACAGTWLVGHTLASAGAFVSLPAAALAFCLLSALFGAVTHDERRQMRQFAERAAARALAPLRKLRRRARAAALLETDPHSAPSGTDILARP
jgi:O-antigen/teichoic acid export membrane protein